MKQVSIVFSPHEDDETLACGGTIIKKIREGSEVYVIFTTDGRNSHKIVLNIQEDPTPEEVKLIRENEAKDAAKILGVKAKNIIFLEFEDGALKDNTSKANALIKKHLTKLKPTEIFIPHKSDIHIDHSSTNAIVLSAVKELLLDLEVYEYLIWSDDYGEFQDILKNPNLIEMDISDIIDLKNDAISMYKSQVDLISPSQTKPILDETSLSNFKKPVEYFLKSEIQKGHIVTPKRCKMERNGTLKNRPAKFRHFAPFSCPSLSGVYNPVYAIRLCLSKLAHLVRRLRARQEH